MDYWLDEDGKNIWIKAAEAIKSLCEVWKKLEARGVKIKPNF